MKGKKNIFEKFGLVEKVQSENENSLLQDEEEIMEEVQNETEERVDTMELRSEMRGTGESGDLIGGMKSKKLFRVEEIYKNYNVESQGINSLFIIESFLKALPDYLPVDVKRESTLNIVTSSGVKIESLITDGDGKLSCLKEFSKSFLDDARDSISKCENEIRRLNEKIDSYKKAINDMKKLEEEQSGVIMYEIQRINNILEFIDPEK